MNRINLGAVSAYAIAKKNGFEGTEAEWLASLEGPAGEKGADGTVSFDELTDAQIAMITGPQGPQGEKGEKGDTGATGPQGPAGTVDLTQVYKFNGVVTGTTFGENKTLGFYRFGQAFAQSATDAPEGLTTGGVLRIEYPAVGLANCLIQTVMDMRGKTWTRTGYTSGSWETAWIDREALIIQEAVGKKRDVVWYALGDSITEGWYSADGEIKTITSNNWVTNVAALNGFTVTNYGVGGMGYNRIKDGYHARGKCNLIDFSECDLVTLAYGVNDYHYDVNVGEITDTPDTTPQTTCGNFKYCIEKILTDNPYCKIIVLLPLNASQWGTYETNWALGYEFSNSGTLQSVIDKLKAICEEYGIEYIEQSKTSICNRFNIQTLLPDGLHPSTEFYPILAKDLASKIDMR